MKRALQITVAILSLIPIAFGAMNAFNGSSEFLDPAAIDAGLDSQFRFLSGLYLGLGLLILWVVPRIDRETALFRLIVLALFLGGLARLYSYLMVGSPPANMLAGLWLELALPLLIPWQNAIRQRA